MDGLTREDVRLAVLELSADLGLIAGELRKLRILKALELSHTFDCSSEPVRPQLVHELNNPDLGFFS